MADDESRKGLLRRCGRRWLIVGILAAVIIVVVIAIIIAAVVTNKTSDDEQKVGGLKAAEECKDISVALGEAIIIKCAIRDDTWKDSILPSKIEAVHENPALNVSVSCSSVGKNVTCELGRANCSSRGRIDVRFFDDFDRDARLVLTKSATVNISADLLDTNITQIYMGSATNSVFNLSCHYKKACDSYQMRFYGNGHILAEAPECSEVSYTDTEGYTIQCTATVPESVIYEYGNGSELYCQLTDGQRVRQESPFLLPSCNDYTKTNSNCNQMTTELYECTSNTTGTVKSGHSKCEVIEACYPLRHFSSQNNTSCLKWCQNSDTLHIDKDGDGLFAPLCNQ